MRYMMMRIVDEDEDNKIITRWNKGRKMKSKNPNIQIFHRIDHFTSPQRMLKFDRSLSWINSLPLGSIFLLYLDGLRKNLDHGVLKKLQSITITITSTIAIISSTLSFYSSQLFLRHSYGLRRIQIGKMVKLPSSRSIIGHQLFLSLFNFFSSFFSFFFLFSPFRHVFFFFFPLLILGPLPLPPLSLLLRRVFTSPSLVLELVHLRVYSR